MKIMTLLAREYLIKPPLETFEYDFGSEAAFAVKIRR